jgi:hypothetical protein
MNLEQIKHLPDEMKERYAQLERLFRMPGWAVVMDWAKARRAEAETRQLHAGNWDAVVLNRGATLAFAALETLESTTEQEFAAAAEAGAERSLLDDEAEYE